MLTFQQLIPLFFENPIGVRLTQGMGYTGGSYIYGFHTGLDLAVSREPAYIKSPVAGQIFRDDDWNFTTGYGRAVSIKFYGKNGQPLSLLLGHFSENFVYLGERIEEDQRIGEQGTTGNSTGQHVHIDFMYGHINPYTYVHDRPRFINTFIDPRRLDEFVNLKEQPMTQEEKLEMAKLKRAVEILGSLVTSLVARSEIHLDDIESGRTLDPMGRIQDIVTVEQEAHIKRIYLNILGREISADELRVRMDQTYVNSNFKGTLAFNLLTEALQSNEFRSKVMNTPIQAPEVVSDTIVGGAGEDNK